MFNYVKRKISNTANALNERLHFRKFSLPDFLIIGAQKSGTTALYYYLIQHPGIIPPRIKEIHYFGNPSNRMKGPYWYTSHFCTVSYKKSLERTLGYPPVTGEATPYMHKPYLPKYVHELLPSAKLIAIFRDPADRAYSQYNHQCRHGREQLSFEDAIMQSPVKIPEEQMNDEWLYHNNNLRSYITRGLYADHLERWYEYFARDRILIINSNEFFSKPEEILNNVLEFLNMPEYNFDIKRLSKNAGNYTSKMNEKTREYLYSIFKPYNRRFSELTGLDFGWPV